jgi:ABC-type Zn2+ transport system substrate-binding protein/surface adhesin
MKGVLRAARIAALLTLTAWAGLSQAAPRVVVSNPALHALVSTLMEGVTEPELLPDAEPARLIGADMVVWVGPEAEHNLAVALAKVPRAQRRAVTLARHVPMLDAMPGHPEAGKDPRFWLDPRLAAVAVRYLTPQLVKLDPDHFETYLDNELKLRTKLHELEEKVAGRAGPYRGHRISGDFSRYLTHRLGMVVTAGATETAPAASAPLSPKAYFALLEERAAALIEACHKMQTARRGEAPTRL